jgi:serine protease Do
MFRCAVLIVLTVGIICADVVSAEEGETKAKRKKSSATVSVFSKAAPETLADLQAIEDRVRKVTAKVMSATVAVQIGQAQGSGVIVSEDGLILSAGHVVGKPGRSVEIILPDGKRLKGTTLGSNTSVDGGMIRITTKGKWPYVKMGKSADLRIGAWCIGLGHPGGYEEGRPPVLRTGRVVTNRGDAIRTGCLLFSGDSGGPLFNMDGRLIGIHSRISPLTSGNYHVPADTFTAEWDRLVAGEVFPKRGGPVLGINGGPHKDGCLVTQVFPDSPAEKAGLKPGDVITRFNDKTFKGIQGLAALIRKKKPDDEVRLKIRRGKQEIDARVKLGARS